MSGLSNIKAISNRFKNFILATAFVATQLFAPFVLSGTAAAAGTITFGSQFENQVFPDDSNTWATGQLDNYSEGDYVNFRYQLTASDASGAGTMQIEYDLGGCNFFTNYFNLVSVTPNIAMINEGTNTLNGSGNNKFYAQKLNVTFNSAGSTTVIFTLQLSNTAGECSGSNTGVRLNVPSTGSGDFGNVGAKTLPMAANQVLENPSLTINKTVASGSASPDDFYFTISPAVNGIINGVSGTWSEVHLTGGTVTIDEVNPDGQFVITEHGPDGYTFESGSGDSCTVTSSGVMTATVTADNDNPVNATCNFTNGQLPANIIIAKQTLPDGDPMAFGFTGDLGSFSLSDGQTKDSGLLAPGTYSVAETEMAGWDLTDVTCSDGSTPDSIQLSAGETVTCTFTNTKRGSITIVKNTVGGDGTFNFTGNVGVTSLSTSGGTASQSANNLVPGSYNIAETVPTGWDLTSATCDDGSTPSAISLSAGEDVTCTFTNTKRGSIVIVKNTLGGDGTFNFTSDFGVSQLTTSGGTASQTTNNLVPGAYSIAETVPDGWDLSSATCDDQSDPAAISLSAGETVICTFTNTKLASISGTKFVADLDGTKEGTIQNWTIYLLVNGQQVDSTQTLVDGSYSFDNLMPGTTYTVSEDTSDTTYTQLYSWDGSTCSSQQYVILLAAGQESTNNDFCNFKNGSISGYKWNDLNGDGLVAGEPKLSGWTIFLDANNNQHLDDGETSTVTDQNGNYSFTNLAPGTYTVCEVMQAGWVQTAPGTVSGCTSTTIDDSGESVTKNFGNQARGTIKVVKDVVNNNGNTGTYQDFSFQLSSSDTFDDSVDVTGNYDFAQEGADPADGAQTVMQVPAGTYGVTEPEANTMGYSTSYNDCENMVVAAGQTVTCTITNNDDAPSLTLNKVVVNDNGGKASESSWTLTAAGASQNPTDLSGFGAPGNADVTSGNNFKADTYTLSESGGPSGYSASAWTCTNDVAVTNNQITLTNGQTTVCTITNNDVAPTLTLKKVVINDNGGTATQANFQASVNAQNVDWDTTATVDANAAYTLSESPLAGGEGYDASNWSCDGGTLTDNQVVLGLDEDVTCTITNDDIAPQLTVYKYVYNLDTNLTKTSGDFTMNVTGNNVSDTSFAGSEAGVTVNLNAGEYAVSEDADSDYTASYSGECTGTISVGESKVCYVENTAIRQPAIHVEKDGPSSAYAGDTVTYVFRVTNPGNVPLSELTVSDDVAGDGATLKSGDVSNPGWLDPGETWVYTVDYTIPSGQKGDVVNTVTVCGSENNLIELLSDRQLEIEPNNSEVCDTDTHTTRILHVLGSSTELPNTGQSPLMNLIAGLSLIGLALAMSRVGRRKTQHDSL
jgi:LPXTG-motif cell wall-anchored protein